jgi:two-component system, cell cycle sensor histidine kinase and response regulator CckA
MQAQEDQMPTLITRSEAPDHPETPTILLVEDEARVRKVMAQVLKLGGYTVLESATAEHAMTHLNPKMAKFTVLITDVMLPGQTGRQLARDLRGRVPGIKTILVSGYGESMALLGTELNDGVLYLPKPFSASSLLAAVRRLLQGGPAPCKKAG